MSTKFKTEKVRLSYAQNMYEAKANDRGEMKFGVTLLIPKTDTVTIDRMKLAAETVKRTKQPGKDDAFYKAWPRTIHAGDGTKPSTGEAYGPECKGCWVVAVSANEKPGILSLVPGFNPTTDKANSGDYAKVSLTAFWFDTGTNKGVTFGLNNVLLLERGERIDGRTSAADDFADEIGEAF